MDGVTLGMNQIGANEALTGQKAPLEGTLGEPMRVAFEFSL
jgi:hypothetical protein